MKPCNKSVDPIEGINSAPLFHTDSLLYCILMRFFLREPVSDSNWESRREWFIKSYFIITCYDFYCLYYESRYGPKYLSVSHWWYMRKIQSPAWSHGDARNTSHQPLLKIEPWIFSHASTRSCLKCWEVWVVRMWERRKTGHLEPTSIPRDKPHHIEKPHTTFRKMSLRR